MFLNSNSKLSNEKAKLESELKAANDLKAKLEANMKSNTDELTKLNTTVDTLSKEKNTLEDEKVTLFDYYLCFVWKSIFLNFNFLFL